MVKYIEKEMQEIPISDRGIIKISYTEVQDKTKGNTEIISISRGWRNNDNTIIKNTVAIPCNKDVIKQVITTLQKLEKQIPTTQQKPKYAETQAELKRLKKEFPNVYLLLQQLQQNKGK